MNNPCWQEELRESITDIDVLCRQLAIPHHSDTPTDYPLLVPRPFVRMMEKGNPNDPLLLQVLPQPSENMQTEGFCTDPLTERDDAVDGILNKYTGRSLLLTSPACGIHCRFCFRRYLRQTIAPTQWSTTQWSTMKWGAMQTGRMSGMLSESEEVILSGGDPLMLDDEELDGLLQSLLQRPNIRRIRIHSRLPIVLPSRLTPRLAEILTLPLPLYLVLHINHPRELSDAFLQRRELLHKPVVLSQSVLLRRINDDTQTLYCLFSRLIDARILPYYLHQLDRVSGTAHFEVSLQEGVRLMTELRHRLPGYAIPRYVCEVPGSGCKEMVVVGREAF